MDTKTQLKRRRQLNKKTWPSEAWFMKALESESLHRGVERNWPILGKYFGDFVWLGLRLVVEIDGSSHNGKEEYDRRRDSEMRADGWRVVRIRFPDNIGACQTFIHEFKNEIRSYWKSKDTKVFKERVVSVEVKTKKSFAKFLVKLHKKQNSAALTDLYKRRADFKKRRELKNDNQTNQNRR